MSILSRIGKAIGLKSTFTRETAGTHNKGINPAHPSRWSGDMVLRKLAEDHKSDITDWSVASGLAKFFDTLDQYNKDRDPISQIHLRVSKRFDIFFDAMIASACHKSTGQEDELNRGPEEIYPDDLLIQQAGRVTRAYYHGDESELKIETVEGWVEIDFSNDNPLQDAVFVDQSHRVPQLEILAPH